MIVMSLFTGKDLRNKVILAFMLVPIVLRMLLIK